jgi:predicted ribosome quality control (RQC) complex YloA/Tae2 family protein
MGYGCETAGPAESFLRLHSPIAIRDKVRDILSRSDDKMKAAYEDCLSQLMETVVTYIEGRGDTLTPNSLDMLDMESLYEDNDDNLYDDDDEDAFYEDKASRHVDEDEDF